MNEHWWQKIRYLEGNVSTLQKQVERLTEFLEEKFDEDLTVEEE